MTDLKETRTAPLRQLWQMLESAHDVMLGSPNPAEHMQPMAPLPAEDENAIWFFTRRDTNIAMAAEGEGGSVMLCVIGKDRDYHACIRGDLRAIRSEQHIERFWSPVASAWFKGKDDPALTMLCFRPRDAAIWASKSGGLRFGWEVLKANVMDHDPHVGLTTTVTFPG